MSFEAYFFYVDKRKAQSAVANLLVTKDMVMNLMLFD